MGIVWIVVTDVPGVVYPLVDFHLGNSDHFSISLSVKIDFNISNITFPRKVRLKSRIYWLHVGEDLFNSNWSAVYNSPNPVSELNKVITSLIEKLIKLLDKNLMIKLGLIKIVLIHFIINKMHIGSGHRIDHTFCGRST